MHLTFGGRYISASKNFLENKEKKKVTGEEIRGIANVLEQRPPVLIKRTPHFWPCYLRYCYVTNKYHRCLSSVNISGKI